MQGDTRSKLLQAAERILIEDGVRGLTTRRVGEVSGLNPTLITYHFGTVAALLGQLLDDNLAPMLRERNLIRDPVPDGEDALETKIRRWLAPLLAPAAYNPRGRMLVVLDEIAAHGEPDVSARLMNQMAELAQIVFLELQPLVPGLAPDELRARMRFVGGAALGPPPRSRLSLDQDDPKMGEEALNTLARFARASLVGDSGARTPPLSEAAQAWH